MMRKLSVTWTPVALALALCVSASAQNQNSDKDKDRENANANQNRTAGETRTIRGVIAGVTLEGEMAIDYRTKRAVEVDAAYLTIVGSPRNERDASRGRDRDQGRDRGGDRSRDQDQDKSKSEQAGGSGRNRQNIYVIWLSPRTQVRDATSRDDKGASSPSIDALEVGDRVEVTYTSREAQSTGGGNEADQAKVSKHGRHRTYFGDATSITILAEPRRQDRDSGSRGNRPSSRDDDQDKVKGGSKD